MLLRQWRQSCPGCLCASGTSLKPAASLLRAWNQPSSAQSNHAEVSRGGGKAPSGLVFMVIKINSFLGIEMHGAVILCSPPWPSPAPREHQHETCAMPFKAIGRKKAA
jgi:hypothetical protein